MRSATLFLIPLIVCGTCAAAPPDSAALAGSIDARLRAGWTAAEVKPAEPADDATFLRRVHLDLVGRIPTVAEVRAFLSDRAGDKRAKLVARLLDSSAHARHSATFWRREWIPQADTPQFANLADDFEAWLAAKLRAGTPYDRLVRDILTAARVRAQAGTPSTFLAASESKPENLAANASRAFLGVNLDCAQCHDHPFARWTRDQFWQTAAFFTRPTAPDPIRFEIVIAGTKKTVGPRLLDGREPKWPAAPSADDGRAVLAEWVTAKDNPYFARNAVNRVWANLLGTGLVEPLDDLSGQTPASHPELLDELAKGFADGGFDLKSLTAAVVLSRAYQLSSVGTGGDPRLFARMAVRGLTGEQLYDSLRVAGGLPADREDLDVSPGPRERKRFADRFRVERPGTAQRSVLQALAQMNGRTTAGLTDVAVTPTLLATAGAPFLDAKGKVESLYLAALGRSPTEDEAVPLVKYVEKGGADGDARKALADIFWALINSTEFNTNH